METESSAFSPVLRRPNRYQNRIQFIAQWVTSKLVHGNTYVLKQRDQRGVVVALYLLASPARDARSSRPDGSIYYELWRDDLSGLQNDRLMVPAKEIIHDTYSPLYHPLVRHLADSSLRAGGDAGLSNPAPIDPVLRAGRQACRRPDRTRPYQRGTAMRLKEYWEANFTGENAGCTAVLGDGLSYEPMIVNPHDAQLIDQLKWTAETVCSAFHVPAYMVGVGPAPTYNNIEALNQQYYRQCLQSLIENIELLLDEGLELPKPYGTEFDLDGLLRMDSGASRCGATSNSERRFA